MEAPPRLAAAAMAERTGAGQLACAAGRAGCGRPGCAASDGQTHAGAGLRARPAGAGAWRSPRAGRAAFAPGRPACARLAHALRGADLGHHRPADHGGRGRFAAAQADSAGGRAAGARRGHAGPARLSRCTARGGLGAGRAARRGLFPGQGPDPAGRGPAAGGGGRGMRIVRTEEELIPLYRSAKNEAKKIVIQTIQRIGTEQAVENSVSVFNIESDEVKGRIIGREGRNIRALEAATGVEIIVDDTPEAILLSCFDPVRREVARLSLHRLVTDGRIHPARIEEVVEKTRKQIEEEIIEVGKRTIIDLGIHGLHPELVKIVGRMKFRSSYGQNLLQHSREVANIAATMAAELGLNVKLAKRAGLLHDIGKVPEQESELPHALLGMQWAEKFGENPEVVNAIGAHHDEVEMTSLLSPIIQVADAISGARPGARRQVLESYIQRLKDLEAAALSFDGVSSAFAIQAGRELRVMVESAKVTDEVAHQLSYDISEKIQNELTYPGQVKVTVIRETRAVNIAR
mgnify:CR=1 FL=1